MGDKIIKAVKHEEFLNGGSRKMHLYLVGYWASGEPHCKRCDMTFEDLEDLALHESHWHWKGMLCKGMRYGLHDQENAKRTRSNHLASTTSTGNALPAMMSSTVSSMFSHFEDLACSLRDWQNEKRVVNFLNFVKKVMIKIEDIVPSCRACARNFSSHPALEAHLHDEHQNTYCWSCRTHAENWQFSQFQFPAIASFLAAMARAHPRVKVEDQVPYRVAQKQPTSYNAPDTAVQRPNLLNSCEPVGHIPRQLRFPDHGNDASGAIGAQNIERTFAMVEEQMFRLTACWTLHCMPCRIIFDDAKEQAEHNAKWHWDNFLCFACDIGFENAIDLKKGQTGLNTTCPGCDVQFETLSLLFGHMESRLCALRNWQQATGLMHLLFVLKQEIDVANRTCNMCKRLFDSEAGLFDHLRYQHENTVCRTCDRVFRDSEEWHKHVISRTPIKVQAYVCAICQPSIAFDMEKNYNDHMWHFHNKCRPCGLSFDNKQDRLVHGAVIHHRCPDCFQFFMSPNDLCKHYKEFHGINPLTVVKPAISTAQALPVKKEFPTVTSPPRVPSIPAAIRQVQSEASPEAPLERVASPREVKPAMKTQGPRIKCATAQPSVIFETYPPRSTIAKAMPKRKKTQMGTSQRKGWDSWEGEPSFSAHQCMVVDAHIKEEQISEQDESGSEDSGSEGSCSEGSDSDGSEEYQSCESGGEEEIKPEPQADSIHEPSASEANTVSDLYCNECRKSFQSSAEKERHNSKWHYTQICLPCDEGFPDKLAYQKHRKSHPFAGIPCIGCEKSFPSYSKMMEHLENGTCKSGCTARLVESVVATHCKGLHQSSSQNINLRCPTCKKKYARMFPLFRHLENRACALRDWIEETGLEDLMVALMEAVEKKKSSTFQCNICQKNFGSTSALLNHQRDKHQRTYCWACKTNFASPAKKQKHVMSGTSAQSGTFICNYCDPEVPFGIEKELCDHVWLEHMACGPCGRKFATVELRKQHDAELHHRCGVCYRFFKSGEELLEASDWSPILLWKFTNKSLQHRETHVVKPPVVEPPVQISPPAPVKREATPPLPPLSPIIVDLQFDYTPPVDKAAPVAEERVPVKTEVIPVRRVTPTTRPVIFAPYPPRPSPVPVPENKKTQSLITGFLIRKT
ncbi:zinc finger BTB domain-containing protein [Fusarium circinatum]|uniref:Zinc finger BTB domain-containing protein n=1 Tax=Fusarium circinatum TaxID=48490 RepID=A0A8H5T0G1_FUSCI|nr:zinc finger BTB domain-containing protein [Fusarium circinatum]